MSKLDYMFEMSKLDYMIEKAKEVCRTAGKPSKILALAKAIDAYEKDVDSPTTPTVQSDSD